MDSGMPALVLRLLLVLLAFSATAYAQPTISGATGSWSHKSSVIINGSGFGSKDAAAPVIWDDASGAKVSDLWDEAWPSCQGNSEYNLAYRTPSQTRGSVGLPHTRHSKYIAGAHFGADPSADCGFAVILWKVRNITSFPAYSYISWYQRADDGWQFGTQNNYKTFAYSTGRGPYNLPNNWYVEYNVPPTSPLSPVQWHLNDDAFGMPTQSLQDPDQNGNSFYAGMAVNPMGGAWTKVEMELKYTDLNDGYIKLWENGVLKIDYAGSTDRLLGTERTEGIGGYSNNYPFTSNWRYFSDVYLDYSRARVILGNAPTLDASTVREVQVPTSWSDSSISLSVNLGAFHDGEAVYLYVVNANGDVNAAGIPVTALPGGPVVDITIPEVSLSAPANASGVVTLNASASDNTGIAGVQFKIDGMNLGAEDTEAPYGITWNSATAINGAHTITAVARDAAGNERVAVATVTSLNTSSAALGLVAAFGFEKQESGKVSDDSGNHHDGAISGGATLDAGLHGSAARFNGVDGLISIADADTLDLSTAMTLEAWINPSTISGWRTALLKEIPRTATNPGGLSYSLYANDDEASTPAVTVNTGGRDEKATGLSLLPLNAWSHLAATYDGEFLQFFVNGELVGRRPLSGSLVMTTGALRIGGNDVWGEYFEGLIDDVRIYNRVLSASEIVADRDTAVVAPEPPPPADPTVFGPVKYTSVGTPILDQKTFDVTDATGEYSLRIANDGVMAAVVAVNGQIVLRPRDFVQSGGRGNDDDSFAEEWERISKGNSEGIGFVPFIEVPVRLRQGANTFFLAFWGRPDTSLTASIVRSMLPPECSITNPVNGSSVFEGDSINVKAGARDNVGVTEVRFTSSDGTLDVVDRSAPYSAQFRVPVGVSEVTFTATAYDEAGNSKACSSTIDVLPTPAPSVAIVSPGPATSLVEGATIPVYVAATAANELRQVDLSVNDVTLASDATGPYSFLFTVPGGVSWVNLRAAAVDAVGKSGTSDAMILPVVADPMTTVRGRVVDKSGKALVGAEVAIDVKGLLAEVFDFDTPLTEMPSLAGRAPSRTKLVSAANLRNPGMLFGADPFGFGTTSHAIRLSGYFEATRSGIYTFTLGANEGGRLIIGGYTLANLPTGTGVFQQGSGSIWLREGLVSIQILTFDNGNPEIQLSYIRQGSSARVVPQALLTPTRSPLRALSGANGLFTIPGVPTALGDITASARFAPPRSRTIVGETDEPSDPVAGGITDLGVIRLR